MKNWLFAFGCILACLTASARADDTRISSSSLIPPATAPAAVSTVMDSSVTAAAPIRSIHLTAWVAGSKKHRQAIDDLLAHSVINSVTIDLKEYEGEVYVPGVKSAENIGAYVEAIPDLAAWLADLKKRGIYTVARIVVFKDNKYPRKNPSDGVHNPQGDLWRDRHHITWLDPYCHEAWRYNLLIAYQAAKIGFDEIQFDYLRFPTDGNLRQIRYSRPFSKASASEALIGFLSQAHQLLHPLGVKISIDVFGLTTTVSTGMGIGQLLIPMAAKVDYICPMVYPSHYYGGEYGIPVPNKEPYQIVHHSLRDALKNLGPDSVKLRPYLQDFSLGYHYGVKEVTAQIQAAADAGVFSWTLWNPRCLYTRGALQQLPILAPPKPLLEGTTIDANP